MENNKVQNIVNIDPETFLMDPVNDGLCLLLFYVTNWKTIESWWSRQKKYHAQFWIDEFQVCMILLFIFQYFMLQ